MSAAKVDVMAVLDRQLKLAGSSSYSGATDDHRDLSAARAAVVELIEAAKRITARSWIFADDDGLRLMCALCCAMDRIEGRS